MSSKTGIKASVAYKRRGLIGTITLRRPDKRNALDQRAWLSLEKAITRVARDKEVRVLLVKGEGESFCAGLDLSPDNEILRLLSEGASHEGTMQIFAIIKWIQSIYTELEHARVPTIAAIQGHCLGAGLELVCCCDMRFCSSNAVFGLPEPRFGIVTDAGGLQRLPKIVGSGKARELAFRAHLIGAEEAKRVGLVNDVCDSPEELYARTEAIAQEIAAHSPSAVQGAKEVLLYNEDVPLARSLEFNAARSAITLPSDDLRDTIGSRGKE
jgi:enoyl-CoA hydratase/carnithine racemase